MLLGGLEQELYREIARIPVIDPHSHIDPHAPAAKSLDELLGYHYYTELAHSAGMDKQPLSPDFDPRERVRAILGYMDRFDNTAQHAWFVEIARAYLGHTRPDVGPGDCDHLWESAHRHMAQPDWEQQVLQKANVEKVFLTNQFDDRLTGFDNTRYVPCLRTDDLVFHLHRPEVRQRLANVTDVEVGDARTLRTALGKLFEHFVRHGARACAISLPPRFSPVRVTDDQLTAALQADAEAQHPVSAMGAFWILAEYCESHNLPFDLMIGVNRRVYQGGVYQGQDLFDQRTSLILYADLFNAFPRVPFCISVLASALNQELVSYSWIFPNVITSGHWWYSNIPVYIEQDCRARLEAVPKTKQIGYYSDAYKLEFILPKYGMYRRILAKVLARDFVAERGWEEERAIELARLLLRENAQRIFRV